MRSTSAALLILGFGVGFFAMNQYMAPRAAELARPIPQFVPPGAASSTPAVDPRVISQLEDTIRKDPENFNALRELGNIRYDQRNFTEAASLYAQALELRPDDINVRSDRGGALLQGDRVDEAIAELRMVLTKEPTHPQALYILGVALLEGKGDREGALSAWNKLVESHPDLPELDVIKRQIKQVEELAGTK
jgi:cytochrome c-type biogenesis protein CcmH/NrfG